MKRCIRFLKVFSVVVVALGMSVGAAYVMQPVPALADQS
jgi:hypothetical protein